MDFVIKNIKEDIAIIARKLGYVIIDTRDNQQYNLVRKFGINNYPRFHSYIKVNKNDYIFSLHLDQKAPSYKDSHAHNGEYWGPLIEEEADRIKTLLK